jgi:hypothetical protein
MDLDWCICDKRVAEGSLYCSEECRLTDERRTRDKDTEPLDFVSPQPIVRKPSLLGTLAQSLSRLLFPQSSPPAPPTVQQSQSYQPGSILAGVNNIERSKSATLPSSTPIRPSSVSLEPVSLQKSPSGHAINLMSALSDLVRGTWSPRLPTKEPLKEEPASPKNPAQRTIDRWNDLDLDKFVPPIHSPPIHNPDNR